MGFGRTVLGTSHTQFPFHRNAYFAGVGEFLILLLAPDDLSTGKFQNLKNHLDNTSHLIKFFVF